MKESTELSASSRALLDAAREGLGPDAAAISRMRGKIGVAVGAGAAAGGVTSVLANKLGILALAIAVATGAAVVATRSNEPASERIAAQPALEEPAPTIVTARESIPAAPASPAPDPGSTIEMEPATKPSPKLDKPAPRAASRTVDLKREVELVDRAMVALRAGDTAGALAVVRIYVAETGGTGQLAEDAAAIEIDALCKRKDPSAQQRLAAFDARWPVSAQRAKLCR